MRERRVKLGLTQAELAAQAGVSRTSITAIENFTLVPSVAAALSIAQVLGKSVEELFGESQPDPQEEVWAWEPPPARHAYWQAEVAGKNVRYPAGSSPMITPTPDLPSQQRKTAPKDTLVIACCDPAAGLLASQFAAATGLRLLVIPRSSRQALEMLKAGLVHAAGMHFSTREQPDQNRRIAAELLGSGDHQILRIARWQEGIAVASSSRFRSVRSATRSSLNWVGREPGSGARQCLDRLLEDRPAPRHLARSHQGVTEAVRSGWADAGICVELVSAEAGLDFLPVQEEHYDICFPTAMTDDRRFQALLGVVRSAAYRKLLADLPGYNNTETGTLLGQI